MSKIEVNQISSQCGSTLTIGQSGDTVTLASGATQSGFGRTGTVDWDTTAKTTNFTAVSGNGYFVNTTSGAITVTLPATPSAGDIVAIKDYANTADTNTITIARNGSNIDGQANDAIISNEGGSVTLVYVDSTKGWLVTDAAQKSDIGNPIYIAATGGTVTTCGNYKIHTFTGPGTFCVSCAGNVYGSNTVDYLVVAGGASSGGYGGGGGAGGVRASATTYAIGCNPAAPLVTGVPALPVAVTGYPITVGAGGSGGPTPTYAQGGSGSNSSFSTITSTGGGGGGYYDNNPGNSGGSGGGGSTNETTGTTPGGAGNTPPVSPPQGQPGGQGRRNCGGYLGGGGGGGAIVAGSTPAPTGGQGNGGNGAGFTNGAFGSGNGECSSCVQYFGGGGGGNPGSKPTKVPSTGGLGGGTGGPNTASQSDATANTGGGGGGVNEAINSGGGSGIVVIRYKYQ